MAWVIPSMRGISFGYLTGCFFAYSCKKTETETETELWKKTSAETTQLNPEQGRSGAGPIANPSYFTFQARHLPRLMFIIDPYWSTQNLADLIIL